MKRRFPVCRWLIAFSIWLVVHLPHSRANEASANPPETAPLKQAIREVLDAHLTAAAAAWERQDYAAARSEFRQLVDHAETPANYRSYAHLRLARSLAVENDLAAAIAEYELIAAKATYPEHHGAEAAELRTELERIRRGLPGRDPAVSRTVVPWYDRFALELFVSPGGRDTNPGTRERPLATLEGARDALRARRSAGLPPGPVAVRLLPGVYPRTASFELTAADSGAADAPVVYRADAPGTAVLYGGRRLTGLAPVADPAVLARLPAEVRGRVRQLDLPAQGLTSLPALQERGFNRKPPAATFELFWNGKPLTVARWPNDGFVNGGPVTQPGSPDRTTPSVFAYLDDRHARWAGAKDGWLYGYFANGWADGTIRILQVDPEKRLVTCGPYVLPERTMQPVAWFNEGKIRYFAFNLLEELDQPGEWYLDHERGLLYVYPPSDPASAVVETGVLEAPMVTMTSVAHVRFEGLVFDLSRANGLDWRDCKDSLVAGCTLRRFAGEGIGIRGGHGCGIYGCDLYSLGRNAMTVAGGDRATLVPGGHFVENCRIHEFGRLDHTYVPGVEVEGVGNRVAHNVFSDCPSTAVHVDGNDHVIEYNRVERAVMESEDQGAMELFGNATYRGVIFRFNYFSAIGPPGAKLARAGRAGIRLDDAISGILVYGNVFQRAAQAFGGVHMNGGRDNIIDNNLFLEDEQGITGGYNPKIKWWQKIDAAPGFMISELYRQRYPALGRLRELPGLNCVWRNVFWKCGQVFPVNNGQTAADKFDLLANVDAAESDPGFADATGGDRRLRPDAPLFARIGFRPIPVEEIGIYPDPRCASRPIPSEKTPAR